LAELTENTWFIIVNPIAGNGRALQVWESLKSTAVEANIDFQSALTKHPGHAVSLAREAVKQGGRRILVVGGDGTANEVVNGMFLSDVSTEDVVLGMVSSGSGNDWVRTIGRHGSPVQVIRDLKSADSVHYDAGLIRFKEENEWQKRYFMNMAGAGFDGSVVERMERDGKKGGGKMVYWRALLRTLWSYKHTEVSFKVDDTELSYPTLSVAAGIGRYNGGGMKQLPFADYNDGKLDLTIITSLPKWKMVLHLPRLSNGSFTKLKEVKTFQGASIRIDTEGLPVEVDGEFLGYSPVEIGIIPDALRILKWKK
jgi:YegS/Rv2252/BmrU family lipid kinase